MNIRRTTKIVVRLIKIIYYIQFPLVSHLQVPYFSCPAVYSQRKYGSGCRPLFLRRFHLLR